jgi:negative regulator of flagellin synthesis FlgM
MVDPVSNSAKPVPSRLMVEPVVQAKRSAAIASDGHYKPSLPTLVSLVAELANQGPPVDTAKIARVRQAIADGSYHLDSQQIADGMLRFLGTAQ